MQRRTALILIATVCVAAIVGMAFVPPIPQSPDYHRFADTREIWGISNFWNVVSNVSFLLVGAIGLFDIARNRMPGGLSTLRVAYGAFFVGIAAVCLGSGYYHWSPSNSTLVWDRLPMSLAFMAFVSVAIGEHIDDVVANKLLWPLMIIGAATVWYWQYTESLGHGDLRAYGLVQFLSLAAIALIWLLIPSRLVGMGYLWAMFLGYALAKVFEHFDSEIYVIFGRQMSGHVLKHVSAAAGMYCFVLALQSRRVRDT